MKKIKNVVFLLLVFVLTFAYLMPVGAATVVNKDGVELSTSAFIYDVQLKVYLNPTLDNNNTVYLNASYRAPDKSFQPIIEDSKTKLMARWYNLKEVHYTPEGSSTELTGKALYDYLVELQELTDQEVEYETLAYETGNEGDTSPAVHAWNHLMRQQHTVVRVNGDGLDALYCYKDEYYDRIELPETCEDEYYIVIAVLQEYDDDNELEHQYSTARAYKVDANKDKCPVCKYEDGKYYDNEGNETTKDEYNKKCNSCKIVGKKYYNKDGKEVTKKEWEKDCGNPETGINNPYVIVAIVVAAGAGIALVSKKKKYV